MVVKENYLVKKRNILNEIHANGMTLQELRFFSIYLSKIKPNDRTTRIVRFPLSDFKAIMELGRINIEYMKSVTNGLLSKIINIPTERSGYTGFQLFKHCRVDRDEFEEWYVEIDAHDEALPLMFEFKEKYFSYQLWNALRLKSSNQLRMYEILKQYEKIGMRILPIENLRNLLGIEKKEYPRFNNFKNRVLDACQQALAENTDITYTYEPHGRKGHGGKILFLKFTIRKNQNYVDQLTLSKFTEEYTEEITEESGEWVEPEDDTGTLDVYNNKIEFLMDACNCEFEFQEIVVLHNEMLQRLPRSRIRDDIQCFHYLNDKYQEMIMRSKKTKISHRFAYLLSMISKEKEYEK